MVAGDDEQGIGVLVAEFLRYGDDLVEHDGVVDGAFPVEGMAVFVHKARFKHQEKAFGVLGKHGKGGPHGVGEIGLIRELGHGPFLEELAVQHAVHVTGMEQAEQLVGVALHGLGKLGVGRGEGIAFLLEHFDVVLVVLALGAGDVLRQEVGGTAADDDVGLHAVEHIHDFGLVGAAAGMPDHGSRGRVLDFGVRNHADGFAGRAAEQFGDGFLLGIVQRVGGTVRVDAEGVHAGLVPGHVGGGGVGGVGGDGIHAACAEHGGVGQGVHRQLAVVHAVGHAFGHEAGARAVAHAQAVGDEQDDVLGDGLVGRAVYVPVCGGFPGGALHRHLVLSGLERSAAQQQRGSVGPLFLGDEFGFRAQNGLGVLPVDQDFGVLFGEFAVKFHLEVETAPAQEAGRIHRINARRGFRDAGEKQGAQQGGNDACVHERFLC